MLVFAVCRIGFRRQVHELLKEGRVLAEEKAVGAVRSALASRDFELSENDSEADVAVTGVVETRGLSDPRLGGFYSYTAKVSLTAAASSTAWPIDL